METISFTEFHLMGQLGKDVSVGEYDPATGLTHITRQRGRLLFNMGASVKKQRREPPPPAATKAAAPPTSTGSFTGLSLYPEEAKYLLQRGALAVFLLSSEGEDATQLSIGQFTSMLAENPSISMACLEVYAFLKDQKLHPRRCIDPLGRREPQHFVKGKICDVAFDVWKTVAVIVESSKEQMEAAAKQKKTKKLMLVFQVIVCRFGDAAPGPHNLLRAMRRSSWGDNPELTCADIPIKLAVVHHDQSVLLFEISNQETSTSNIQM